MPPKLVLAPKSASELKGLLQLPNYGNDYNNHYLQTGTLPQAHVQNIEFPYVGYPKLEKLHNLKEKQLEELGAPIVGCRTELGKMEETLSKWTADNVFFDIIMVGGCFSRIDFSEINALPIGTLCPRPGLVFVWAHSSQIIEARQALECWGFRRSEDIVFMPSSADSVYMPKTAPNQLFVSSTWHCLMGIKGTIRRSDDGHLINCNIDTDVIIEKPNSRANIVPEDMYRLIEKFSLMSRRLHVIPSHSPENLPVRLRPGWVIASPDSLISNFKPHQYRHRTLIPLDPEIDALRPKTPPGRKPERTLK